MMHANSRDTESYFCTCQYFLDSAFVQIKVENYNSVTERAVYYLMSMTFVIPINNG